MPPHELAGRGYPLTGFSGVANSLVMSIMFSFLALTMSLLFLRAVSKNEVLSEQRNQDRLGLPTAPGMLPEARV
jgi:hypothetical protein